MAYIRDSDDLVLPAVERSLRALEPDEADAAYAQIARITAKDIDRMPKPVREAMMPQHSGILMRALDVVAKHAEQRRKAAGGARGVSRLDELRAAQASRRKPA